MNNLRIVTTFYVKWVVFPEFPEYKVSNNGMVSHNGSLLKIRSKTKTKYLYIFVRKVFGKKRCSKKFDIHKLVWMLHGNMPLQRGYEIHHKDFNFLNNHIDNLILLPIEQHYNLHGRSLKKNEVIRG